MLSRSQIGIILLPIFLIGGILAPVLHSVHHASETVWLASEHERIASEINHVHSEDGVDLFTPAVPVLSDDLVCVLCAPLVREHSEIQLASPLEASDVEYHKTSKSAENSFNFSSPLGRAPPSIS